MNWDEYFHSIAVAVSSKSRCWSRQIGAIAVHDDKYVVAMGYNGPPVGYPHCVPVEMEIKDDIIGDAFLQKVCPRRAQGFKSGEGYEICPAAHAERNVICEAARMGIKLKGATMYMTCGIPCRECAKDIANAGIICVVVENMTVCPESGITGLQILKGCQIKIRSFGKTFKGNDRLE